MATQRGWVHPEVYREARRHGFRPDHAAYLGRPPVVVLDSDPDVSAYDAGSFVYAGETFTYRVEWDDDCLCREDDEVSADDYDGMEHRGVIVSDGVDEASLWSVCGDTRSWLGRLSDERHVAEVVRELADEVLSIRKARQAKLWA